jgi:rhodanese-related sulfurtransferase
MLTITPKELTSLLEKSPNNIELIDVRWTGEYSEVHITEARNIPLHLLPMKMNEIDTTKQVIFICRSGGRSGQACQFALNSNIKAYNLTGGMNDYEREFPARVVHGEKKKLFGLF